MTIPAPSEARGRRPRAAWITVAVTATACLAALLLRTPIRSRYWAWRAARTSDQAERALLLTALCNAGDAGRWGIGALLADRDAEIRQLGVVVLQHVPTEWARGRLVQALSDADGSVRELAALGLAVQGDDSIIPTLEHLYAEGDPPAAQTACLALERLATAAAVAALARAADRPADPERRAALVDALEGVGAPACVPPLLRLLTDHRICQSPPRAFQLSQAVQRGLLASGQLPPGVSLAQSAPAPRTVAERAAEVLGRITGLVVPFSSAQSSPERDAATRQWTDWLGQHGATP